MEPSNKIKQIFELCDSMGINLNINETCYNSSELLKPIPCICIGNNNKYNIIEELQEEGSSKLTWTFYGDIIDILYHCFKVNGYEIKILYRVDKVGNIEGTFSLIIDDSDFIVQKINSLVINEETLIDLDNISDEYNSSSDEEIYIEVVEKQEEDENKKILIDLDNISDEYNSSSDEEIYIEVVEKQEENEEDENEEQEDGNEEQDENEQEEEDENEEQDENEQEEEDENEEQDGDEEQDENEQEEEEEENEEDDETMCPFNCKCVNCLEEINDT